MKLALCMIVRGDSEIDMFKRCLKSFMPHVDGLYVAVTGLEEHKLTHELVASYGGKSVSTETDTNPCIYAEVDGKTSFANFAAARNVSFDLVDEEYDYLLWADVDDVLMSGEELKEAAERGIKLGVDSIFFTYWYSVKTDERGIPYDVEITQMRERLLKPGVFKWVSRLHEVAVPIDSNYNGKQFGWPLTEGRKCVWVHLTTHERVDKALTRNKAIIELQLEEEKWSDPRTIFNYAKILFDIGGEENYKECIRLIEEKYLRMSGWDAERADALSFVGKSYEKLNDYTKAMAVYHRAIIEYPRNPMNYLDLANAYFELGRDEFAKQWLDIAMKLPPPQAEATIGNHFETKLVASTLKIREAQRDGNPKEMVRWAEIRASLLKNPNDPILKDAKHHEYINEVARGLFNYGKWLKDSGHQESLVQLVESIPDEFVGLPFVQTMRADVIPPKTWTDNSIVYYASFGAPHFEKWDWRSLETGIGGSESAVIYLSEEWSKKGYDVTVYADIPETTVSPNGVKWVPYNTINWRDEFNVLILWRSPHLIKKANARKLYMDLHDIASQLDWDEERMKKIDKVFFKSQYHRMNVPKLPDEKAVIISNGITQ